MSLVKICGNRTPDDVLGAAEAGADFVGMIFARSERRVDAQQASAMVRALGSPLAERPLAIPPPARSHVRGEPEAWFRHGAQLIESYLESKRPLTVGVFADQAPEEVNAIAEEAGRRPRPARRRRELVGLPARDAPGDTGPAHLARRPPHRPARRSSSRASPWR